MTTNVCQCPRIIWLLPALRQLQQSQALAYMRGGPAALTTIQNQISDRLAALYRNDQVIVLQQYTGYRPDPNQFILLVEIANNQQPARYIVKLDDPSDLQHELAAWHSCRPIGLHHDPVMMILTALHDVQGNLNGLQYEDAQQFIGGVSVALEDAFVDSVLFGNPAPTSLAEIFSALYGRMAHLFYGTSVVENPGDPPYVLRIPRLTPSLESWQACDARPRLARQAVNALANAQAGCFRDPVDYLTFVRGCFPSCDASGQAVRPPLYAAPSSLCTLLAPPMLRGCAHGDLHGRNVLVGVAHGRARWPAVFDYENMSRSNPLVWDFVKMETELKMRVYPHLFEKGNVHQFIPAVQRFEIELADQADHCHEGAAWPQVDDAETNPLQRLRTLLLTLRQLASLHLGKERGRTHEALDEWYFGQACYGVHVGRFTNLDQPQLLGGYIAAGVATARYLRHRQESIDALSPTLVPEDNSHDDSPTNAEAAVRQL